MKIGVITHWRSDDNYGQTLQLYALQQILIKLGHDPFLIRYITNEGSVRWRLKRKINALKYIPSIIQKKIRGKSNADPIVSRGAQAFISQHINVSEKVFTRESILQSPPDADAFISGSDQVWNKLDGSYFLDFIKNSDVKKISYAASFGGVEYHGLDARYVKKWLNEFDAVSVRETDGLNQCKRLGMTSAQVVPDPTLLLSKDDYQKLFHIRQDNKRFILVYLLGSKTSFDVTEIYKFAKEKGLDVIYVASQGREDEYEKCFPDVSEWLSLMSSAEYVVTNSFHGTVFSLIFKRQFLAIPLSGNASKMNGRLTTLLNRFSLMGRFSNDILKLSEEIDYSKKAADFEEYREEGLSFLNKSLKK